MGQQPTGEKGEPVCGIAIDRFEDGKVAESWTPVGHPAVYEEHWRDPEAAEVPAAA